MPGQPRMPTRAGRAASADAGRGAGGHARVDGQCGWSGALELPSRPLSRTAVPARARPGLEPLAAPQALSQPHAYGLRDPAMAARSRTLARVPPGRSAASDKREATAGSWASTCGLFEYHVGAVQAKFASLDAVFDGLADLVDRHCFQAHPGQARSTGVRDQEVASKQVGARGGCRGPGGLQTAQAWSGDGHKTRHHGRRPDQGHKRPRRVTALLAIVRPTAAWGDREGHRPAPQLWLHRDGPLRRVRGLRGPVSTCWPEMADFVRRIDLSMRHGRGQRELPQASPLREHAGAAQPLRARVHGHAGVRPVGAGACTAVKVCRPATLLLPTTLARGLREALLMLVHFCGRLHQPPHGLVYLDADGCSRWTPRRPVLMLPHHHIGGNRILAGDTTSSPASPNTPRRLAGRLTCTPRWCGRQRPTGLHPCRCCRRAAAAPIAGFYCFQRLASPTTLSRLAPLTAFDIPGRSLGQLWIAGSWRLP